MTATTCKLCFAPISTCACVTDEHLAARFAAMRQPPLREFLGARERIRVRQFPDVVAGEQTEWSALAIEAIGDTPAARAATHLDHQRWVRQQLSLRTDDTAPARAVSMGVVKTDREFAALAKTATRLGLAVSQGAGTADRELRAMVDEVRGRIFGTPDEQSSASARIFNLAGELLLWREVCGDLVAADDEARRTWLTKQVRLAEVYRHNLEAVASMLAEGRAYGGGPDDAVGYLAEVLRSAREPWHNTPTCPRCTGPLVAYDHDDESPTPPGLLRCTACDGVAKPVASYAPGTKQADIEEFEAVLQTWATGGYMLKPVGLTVEFPEPSSAGGSRGDPIHAALAKYCDEQASKRIIGQTMTSDTGASRAQAEVHERVAGWVIEADAAELAETILRDLVEPYVRMNFGMDGASTRAEAPMLADVLSLFPREAWSPFTSSSRHDSWCTPRWMVDLMLVLWPEGIDVDPCSNEHSIIPATTAYDGKSRERDGLLASWRGEAPPTRRARAFCNPPYSHPGPWYERAAHQALTAGVDVLLLVNVTTATRAFNRFRPRQPPEPFAVELELCRNGTSDLPRASAIGFFHRRIGFLDAGAPIKSNEYEQMILYWGPDAELFREVFAPAAWCPGGAPVRSPFDLESSHPRNEAHMQPQAHPWTDGRLMSFAMTTQQLVDGTKTVTRRYGWKNLKVGARLRAVHKAMGLRRGESPHVLAVIEVVSVRREPLNAITDDDVAREGFPAMNAADFVAMFLSKVGGVEHAEVTRIEFRVVWRPGGAAQEARP